MTVLATSASCVSASGQYRESITDSKRDEISFTGLQKNDSLASGQNTEVPVQSESIGFCADAAVERIEAKPSIEVLLQQLGESGKRIIENQTKLSNLDNESPQIQALMLECADDWESIKQCQKQPDSLDNREKIQVLLQKCVKNLNLIETYQNASINSSWMQNFFDYGSIVLFFATYGVAGIHIATAVAMGVLILQIAWLLAHREPVSSILWADLALFTLSGGASYFFQNPLFINLKPAILNIVMAAVIFASEWSGDKNWIQGVADRVPKSLPRYPETWTKLNRAWAASLGSWGVAGLAVACAASTETVMIFRSIELAGNLIFGVGQSIWLNMQPVMDHSKIV